jgi:hypothetical protein
LAIRYSIDTVRPSPIAHRPSPIAHRPSPIFQRPMVTLRHTVPGGGEGASADLVDVTWLSLADEDAWPEDIRGDEFLAPQLRAIRASLG